MYRGVLRVMAVVVGLLSAPLPTWAAEDSALRSAGRLLHVAAAPVGERAGTGPLRAATARFAAAEPAASRPGAPAFLRIVIEPAGGSSFEGTGTPGAELMLMLDGAPLARAHVDAGGRWRIGVAAPLTAGDHLLVPAERAREGRDTVAGESVRIAIPTIAPAAPMVAYEAPLPQGRQDNPLRRRAEELAEAASERFSQVVPAEAEKARPGEMRKAEDGRAGSPPPGDAASDRDGATVLAPVVAWAERAAEAYQQTIVPALAGGGTGGAGIKVPSPGEIAAAREPSAQASESGESLGDAIARVRDAIQEWLARANRTYQTEIARKLERSLPGGVAIAAGEQAAEKRAEEKKAAEKKTEEARALAREREQKAEAERRQAEARKVAEEEAQRREAEQRAARLRDEQRAAEETRRTAEAERQALEAEAAARQQAEEAARKAAAEERYRRAEEITRQKNEAEARMRAAEIEQRRREAAAVRQRSAEDARRRVAETERKRAAEEAAKEDERQKELARKELAQKELERSAKEAAERQVAERQAAEESAKAAQQAAAARAAADQAALEKAESERAAAEKMRAARVTAKPSPAATALRRVDPRIAEGSGEAGPVDLPAVKRGSKRGRMAAASQAGTRVAAAHASASAAPRCRRAGHRISPPGTYVVNAGDTLSGIVARHYGGTWKLEQVAWSNRRRVRNPDLIRPCQRIWLP